MVASNAQAQSRFHFDIDYHYSLGLSTSFENGNGSRHWGRSDYKMGGNSLRFTGRYDMNDMISAGLGFGWDRYTEPDYNTLPVFVTLRYKPIQTLKNAYCFTDLGYGIKPKETHESGFLMNLGIGYTKMLSAHFGLNLQIAYNYKIFDDSIMSLITNEKGEVIDCGLFDSIRHSISFGIGVTF